VRLVPADQTGLPQGIRLRNGPSARRRVHAPQHCRSPTSADLGESAVSGPAARAELRDLMEQRGGRFSGRAVAEAIRKGLIRPFLQPAEAPGMDAYS
jgi:hypothetical protein